MVLPFKCPYCNHYYCAEHRLPENHNCPEYWMARAPRPQPPPIITPEKPYEYTVTYGSRPTTKLFQFSSTELKHLTIGALLVMGVGLSYIPQAVGLSVLTSPEILVGLVIIFTLSFFLHEIAHKLSAQHYGLWAEFRITLWGAIITLISMLPLSFFKIISPGAVMIAGPVTEKEAGRTALAGPLTNIVISAICATVLITTQNTSHIPFFGAWINAVIALFNLIPFGIMDGLKVFRWNKLVWTAAFIASVALTVYVFMFI